MTRRFLLHVGVPKTGTTYLQDVLWASRKQLRRQGVRLPLRDVEDHFFLTLALRGRLDRDVDPPQAHDVLERLGREVRRSGSADLLVSHELLAAVEQPQIEALSDLLSGFEVHVIVTARDLARQVPAEWQQQVKTRSEVPYARFLERVVAGKAQHFWSVQDVASVAERWGRSLPAERVHIVTVPPPGAPREELLTRFCSAAGICADGLRHDQARSNASLGFEQTELLRRVNIALGDRLRHPRSDYGAVAKSWFAEQVLAQQPARRRLGLPLEHWDWAVRESKELVVRLERAGYRVHGDLADLVPISDASHCPRRPAPVEVTEAGVTAIAAMLAEPSQRDAVSRVSAIARVALRRTAR